MTDTLESNRRRNRLMVGRDVCDRCRRPVCGCYCAHVRSIDTRTKLVILQHPRERDVPIGTAHMATLFGFVMLSHQIGGFLGAWLGGKAFEATGSYDWMWYADILLAIGAALVHLPIREKALPPRAAVPA